MTCEHDEVVTPFLVATRPNKQGSVKASFSSVHSPIFTSMWQSLSIMDCMYLYAGLTRTVWWACRMQEALRFSTITSVRQR